ncbi:MAG TPA: SDR family oxidoreductase [Candidatus Nanoarchaeia archaeon]|nr:SDR family oxidoreductase [Candidatus Nanoarchaeia archaeon]
MNNHKHILVIGGTKGMGRAFIQKMSGLGHAISAVGRSEPYSRDRLAHVDFWRLDLLERSKISKLLEEIITQNGKIDSLVFFQRYRGEQDTWDKELEVSVTATKEIVDSLTSQFTDNLTGEGCSIVMVSSLASQFITADQPASYHVAKAALDHLVRYYAVKLGPRGIRVNAVSPCAIQKEESQEYYLKNQELAKLYETITPLRRMGNSRDLANAIAFLCSQEASFITGQNLILDGGISIQGHEALARRFLSSEEKNLSTGKHEQKIQDNTGQNERSDEKNTKNKATKKTVIVHHRQKCGLCESSNLEVVMKLEPTPIADRYLSQEQRHLSLERYPLDLSLCKDCGHVQLVDVIDPELLYAHYTYVTSSSLGLVEHFSRLASSLLEKAAPSPESLVIDIGSNDGSLLKFFKEKGMKVLGVDPAAEIATRATTAGIKTIPTYFTKELAAKIKVEEGPASIITANNVFAHADNLADIAKGVHTLLAPEGIFIFEVSYLVHILERFLFDTIYHEHLCYHNVRPLQLFFQRHGLELVDAEYVPTKGGSLRGTVQLQGGPKKVSERVTQLVEMEEKQGYHQTDIYRRFAQEIERKKENLLHLLKRLKEEDITIAGYGASHTVTTLTYHLGLGSYLDFLLDDNPQKQNTFSPGFHIPVLGSQALYDKKPDYVIILAWQYAEPIMKKNRAYLEQGGKFIIPLPSLKVITKEDAMI